jgi:aldose 1-epimerase
MSGIEIDESIFGLSKFEKQNVLKFTLKNKNNFSFSVITYGASVQSINLLDKNNKKVNVALGFDTIQGKHFF